MQRNRGIDALRILSMFMVVVLHVLGQGGMLRHADTSSVQYSAAWFLEIACYCATNCFALISGYVMYRSKARLSKAVSLWLQVAFYTISALLVAAVFMPEQIGMGNIMDAVFPVGRRHYWYISAYFGLLLLTPVLNIAVEHLEKRVFGAVLAAVFVMFTLMPRFVLTDAYGLSSGYTTLWLVVLYLGGAYLHKYNVAEKVSKGKAWLIVGASVLFTFLFRTVMELFPQDVLATDEYKGIFVSYTSPTMVLAAVGLLIALGKQSFGKFPTKVITLCAPAALGVYLIHTNLWVWDHLLRDRFVSFLNQNVIVMILLVVTMAAIIYAACTALELLRIWLFKLIRVDVLCSKLDEIAAKLWHKKTTV